MSQVKLTSYLRGAPQMVRVQSGWPGEGYTNSSYVAPSAFDILAGSRTRVGQLQLGQAVGVDYCTDRDHCALTADMIW